MDITKPNKAAPSWYTPRTAKGQLASMGISISLRRTTKGRISKYAPIGRQKTDTTIVKTKHGL